jgi:2-dehydro-3-deoxygluconokinase
MVCMAKVVTMGEIMLRLSTPGQQRFVQAESFNVVYGGGEANVAVSLANFGHEAYFVTKLPEHEIGQSAINQLNKYHVNTNYIARGGDRIGIYYLETGASMRPSKVIYDRAGSSIACADVKDFDFDEIFKDANWFHWSGITPAISKKAAELTKVACIEAKKRGITVSVDLNYRKKLWSPNEAQSVMKDLMQYVDICIGNEEDAELVLGFKPKHTDVSSGKLEIDSYKEIFKEMKEVFGFKMVATTLRESYSATKNGWSALLFDGKTFYQSKHYIIDPIIDRVGGGDSFSGGLIHGLLTKNPQDAIEFAVAASALKHTIFGDFNQVSEKEVEALAKGDASGRVQR